jgi:hypothetical protein
LNFKNLTVEDQFDTLMKLAVTVLSWFMITVHFFPLVLSHPDQPEKVDPLPTVAVRVTIVHALHVSEQVDPQLIPIGELFTVPLPLF